ncbi:MAG: hypothetical protein ABI311_06225 [Gemmatimonadaceae bacterium]
MMRTIRRGSRFMALLLSLAFANLMLVSSAYACPTLGTAASAGAMPGMDAMLVGATAPGTDNQPSASTSDLTQHRPSPEEQQRHSPCGSPWAPGVCQSMAPCAPVALVSTESPSTTPVRRATSVADLTVALLPLAASAPELPPPRA